jgi:two-component system, NtrC family, response regulator AtoC
MGSFTVLIVDDERTLARSIRLFLMEQGYEAEVAEDAETALALLEKLHPDFVFLDVRLPKGDGLELLRRIKAFDPNIYVVVMTAYGSVEGAVQAMKQGAFDYLKKPVDLNELKILLDRAREDRKLRQELSYYRQRERTASFEDLIGQCPAMRRVFEQIDRLAALEEAPPVLITGETGTGKGMVARALHYRSRRAQGPFIEVDCTALPATLVEAELFGYEKGAFTDAKESKMGLFEAADGGTLFLDEIGDLDPSLQGKLLKVIEERTVRRLGSVRSRKVDVWILAATNKNLEAECARGNFRKELYFRLAVLTIHLPPLRERGEDILLLAQHFLEKFSAKYGKRITGLSDRAAWVLTHYPWPGNVRELQHVIERAVFWSPGGTIEPEHLGLSLVLESRDLKAGGSVRPAPGPFPEGLSLFEIEKRMIEQALEATRGNCVKAARLLGISRDTLRYRMKKFNISRSRFRTPREASPRGSGSPISG